MRGFGPKWGSGSRIAVSTMIAKRSATDRRIDIIITETGTSSFGLTNVALPSHSTYIAQILWGAIGWSVGACLGAALAATEGPERRTVLFVGDGSLQLVNCFPLFVRVVRKLMDLQTLQEIGTMLRRGVYPYLFVLNNDGYEIERQIHGVTAKYNDIQMYDHQMMLPFLAGKQCKVSSRSSGSGSNDKVRHHTSRWRFTLRKSFPTFWQTRRSISPISSG